MKTVRAEKLSAVKELTQELNDSILTLFLDYRGLNVNKLNALRNKLHQNKSKFKVEKNTFSRIALKQLNFEYEPSALEGPTAIITSQENFSKTADEILRFMAENEVVKLKGGLIEGKYIKINEIKEIAKMPSRDELIMKAIAYIKSPVSGLILSLSSPINGLINILNSIKEQKAGGEK